jgi:hypothetical protein
MTDLLSKIMRIGFPKLGKISFISRLSQTPSLAALDEAMNSASVSDKETDACRRLLQESDPP